MKNSNSCYSCWGICEETNFTKVPEVFLSINNYVKENSRKLSPVEMIVLLHLITAWQQDLKFPVLPKSFFADRLDISTRQIQRILSSLETKGYISKMSTYNNNLRSSNEYDLAGILELISDILSYQKSDQQELRKVA